MNETASSMPSTTNQQIEDGHARAGGSRGQWGHKVEFFLATLGYSVGIGEITRFPYLCMQNGGGAFLIPFLVAMFACGMPLFYVEVALGQFSGLSPLTMWSLCPIFKGIGYACVILSGIVGCYYNMLLTWCLFYLINSFAVDVPWRGCDNHWNSENCYDPFSQRNLANHCVPNGSNNSFPDSRNCSQPPENFTLPSEDFWNHQVLGLSPGINIENMGSLQLKLVLSLFGAWLIVFLCQMNGIKTSGKVVYVTATAPYLLLTALLIRGVTLDGATEGLIYYLKPNLTALVDHNVWIEASLQMFFSLGPSWGGLITMASYNKFHHRFYIESVGVPFADLFTALYGGFAIFSVLGFMAKRSGIPMSRFSKAGPGLAFVVYPQAIAEMPFAPLWSVCFFLTLLTLGIDSQFGFVDTVVSGICDLKPQLRKRKILVTALVTASCFLIGLPFCSQGGMYLYTLIDWYTASITVVVVAFLEIITIAYIYGLHRFSEDVKYMLGQQPNFFWKLCWFLVTPLFMTALLFIGLWNLGKPRFQNYEFPTWSIAVGWLVALVSFAPIPVLAIHALLQTPKNRPFSERLASIFHPTQKWVPAKRSLVEEYQARYDPCNAERSLSGFESLFKDWVCDCTKTLCNSGNDGKSYNRSQTIDLNESAEPCLANATKDSDEAIKQEENTLL